MLSCPRVTSHVSFHHRARIKKPPNFLDRPTSQINWTNVSNLYGGALRIIAPFAVAAYLLLCQPSRGWVLRL